MGRARTLSSRRLTSQQYCTPVTIFRAPANIRLTFPASFSSLALKISTFACRARAIAVVDPKV
jgi:hypothetical protein